LFVKNKKTLRSLRARVSETNPAKRDRLGDRNQMKKTKKPIYLDVCVLSQPFDDQSFLRIRLETEAVNLILSKIRNEEYELVVSPIHLEEIEAIYDIFERIELQERLKTLGKSIGANLASTVSHKFCP